MGLGKNISIEIPLGKTYIRRNYTNTINFTPEKVFELVYHFYQEPLTKEDIILVGEGQVGDKKISIIKQKKFSRFFLMKDKSGGKYVKLFLKD